MDEEVLRKLQLTQLEILKVFDKFCCENGLKYSLYAGTLLGAVRHKGFIPWDDDLDVCMPRSDYDEFLKLWQLHAPDGYILQNKDNSVYFDQSFSKIRKDHTTYLEQEWQIGNHHTGIFIDVFPIDRIPDGQFNKWLFKWNCMKYQLLCREFVPPRSNMLIRSFSRIMLNSIPVNKREKERRKLLEKIKSYDENHDFETVGIETMSSLNKPFSSDMLDSFIELPFEDGTFMCFQGWDDHLKRKFGDYMQLPPVEEREWKHHPIVIDFEHNYDELERS